MQHDLDNISVKIVLSYQQTETATHKRLLNAAAKGMPYQQKSHQMRRILIEPKPGFSLPDIMFAKQELNWVAKHDKNSNDFYRLASNQQHNFLLDLPISAEADDISKLFFLWLSSNCESSK